MNKLAPAVLMERGEEKTSIEKKRRSRDSGSSDQSGHRRSSEPGSQVCYGNPEIRVFKQKIDITEYGLKDPETLLPHMRETENQADFHVCHRCQNRNQDLFFLYQGHWYCRKCLDFGPLEAGQWPRKPKLSHKTWTGHPKLEFELMPFQKEASTKALDALKRGKDVLVYAAAGAGKTEISMESICWYLARGKKVCFAISRRQVVMEIAKRLAQSFPDLDVIPVCEGYTKVTDADLIVCTTHQLYRYPFCFDLLILDELDAFPYAGNEVLEAIAAQSCTGQKMLLSATPDEKSLQAIEQGKMEMVNLFKRPHEKPLCVPKVIRAGKFLMVLHILANCRRFIRQNKQVLLFVPRIADTTWMKLVVSIFFRCEVIHSKSADKDEIMARFHEKKTMVLICTTLLERGITVPSVQVIVYRADHPVFTKASLIQIFGRAGRSFKDPEGEGIALVSTVSKNLQECIRQLRYMNAASGVEAQSTHAKASRPL